MDENFRTRRKFSDYFLAAQNLPCLPICHDVTAQARDGAKIYSWMAALSVTETGSLTELDCNDRSCQLPAGPICSSSW